MNIKIAYILLFALLFVGCKPNTSDDKQILSVTIEPQRYLLEQLVGDKYSVNCIIPSGANPETFDPVPSQLVKVNDSKAFFVIGSLSVETALISKIKENDPDVIFIDCSEGISLIEDHSHDHCDKSSGTHDGGVDPHIWSSPATAKMIVKNMYTALVSLDEANKDYYTENYNVLLGKINTTDTKIKEYLAKTSVREFIIYHPALSYYAQEYGLVQHVIENEGKSPTPNQLAHLIDTAKEKGIKLVLIQQEYDVKNGETVVKAIDGRMMIINLLNYNWHEEMINIAKAFTHE